MRKSPPAPWIRATLALLLALAATVAAAETGRAPPFTLAELGGGSLSLNSLHGRVVLVNFWATWCGPCRQEMPALDRIYRRYAPQGLVVVGISVDAGAAAVKRLLARHPVHYPILLDPTTRVSSAYRVEAMPSTFIIDREGEIRYVHHGYRPGEERAYEEWIRRLLH
ncbi:MAG TPA: TlpA disulfide reductase family protein [Steroidobacteraceae bacterium]|nr:TlpA disulfide reductase family protein [Steroidobacteraceae bacterium]